MKMNNAKQYPGFGQPCNQCGACCMHAPCVVAERYGLWHDGEGCKAHQFRAGKWWCDFAINPGRYVSRFRRATEIDLKVIRLSVNINGQCTTRRAEDITHCDFCGKPITKKFGIDLSNRVYCHRRFCRFDLKFNLLAANIGVAIRRFGMWVIRNGSR